MRNCELTVTSQDLLVSHLDIVNIYVMHLNDFYFVSRCPTQRVLTFQYTLKDAQPVPDVDVMTSFVS